MGKSSSQLSRRPRELKNNDEDYSNKGKRSKTTMEAEEGGVTEEQKRIPLSEVVSDCVERWFQDTLKEAKAGDVNMQVLVSQMYNSGYGVPKDANKGKFWMTRVSRVRSSVWKVSKKRPGYNASDSDSDELAGGS
ncbi:hypothetical protein CDL12_07614 [Handroanthus impetiginosus]|uniref:Uncharacterized protein n=1 Tax=Handroanthus impetiginosus TaxID=429701 RepID=A0A2G9HQZ4_9LAMI|nr:hypothetical protein CDL12_07614 [Handroanthus impetiginosus]